MSQANQSMRGDLSDNQNSIAQCLKKRNLLQLLLLAGFEPRPTRVGRSSVPITSWPPSQLQIYRVFLELNLLQKLAIFGWVFWPQGQESASTTSPGFFSISQLSYQDQWWAESWRILRFLSFTGKVRQKFPSKIGYSRSSKRFLHTYTVVLSPKNSALEVGIVKNVKFNDDLAHFF